MTNGECRHRTGMHLWQDVVYTQVCDPETYEPVPYGEEGTPVYTHLERTSQPMIRLVSGDRTRWTDAPCPCGRTYPRLPDGLYGRFDDMIVVRGENVYPSAIEDTLRAIDGFGGEFQVIVSRRETMDELLVRAEAAAGLGGHRTARRAPRAHARAPAGAPRRPPGRRAGPPRHPAHGRSSRRAGSSTTATSTGDALEKREA